jgi:hypothetical protein
VPLILYHEIYKIMILLAISETSTFCQEKRRRNAELRQYTTALIRYDVALLGSQLAEVKCCLQSECLIG